MFQFLLSKKIIGPQRHYAIVNRQSCTHTTPIAIPTRNWDGRGICSSPIGRIFAEFLIKTHMNERSKSLHDNYLHHFHKRKGTCKPGQLTHRWEEIPSDSQCTMLINAFQTSIRLTSAFHLGAWVRLLRRLPLMRWIPPTLKESPAAD